MQTTATRTRFLLHRGQSARLESPQAARLSSAAGTLWVTVDNDPRDVVLEAGQGLDMAARSGALLVSALGGDAVLDVQPEGAR